MKLFSLAILIFSVNQYFAQEYNHIIYKQDFEQVYSTVFDSMQFDKALVLWNEISNKYSEVHTEEHILRAYCYHQLGNNNKAAKCMKEAWSHQLCDPAYLEQITEFKWLKMLESFNKKQMKLVEKGYEINSSLNSKDYDSLSFLIEKLRSNDQTYRSFLTEEQEHSMNKDQLIDFSARQDSLDMIEFIRIYNKWGFPGEKISVIFSERLSIFILHFVDYDWFYDKMYPLFEEDVITGRMPATLFLMLQDRHSTSQGKPAEFAVYQNPKHFHPTQEEIEEIKNKRFEMGVSRLFRIPYSK